MSINEYKFNQARQALTQYMIKSAAQTAKACGFSYRPCEDAPGSYAALEKAFNYSWAFRTALPVYSGASDKTIYTTPEGNYAFRFVHDLLHVMLKAPFDAEGEVRVMKKHAHEIAKEFGTGSLEYKLFIADTFGQLAYSEMHGSFPEDQLAFAKAALTIH